MRILTCTQLAYLVVTLSAVGCGGDDAVDSDEQARRAYLCLDGTVQKSIDLGFAGFNSASSANITPQTGMGKAGGTITVSGQVDQGASANKGMRLEVGLVKYDDGPVEYNSNHDKVHVVFDTSTTVTDQPYLAMMLKNIPAPSTTATGTLDGTLTSGTTMTGVYNLSGDLKGTMTLNLTITGVIGAGASAGMVTRVAGMTMVTGTATNSDGGVYNISLTL